MNGEIDEKIEELKGELDKLKEELKHIDLKEIEHFSTLLNWMRTIRNYVEALKRYVDAEHEIVKQGIEALEFYGKEIEALKEEMKIKRREG